MSKLWRPVVAYVGTAVLTVVFVVLMVIQKYDVIAAIGAGLGALALITIVLAFMAWTWSCAEKTTGWKQRAAYVALTLVAVCPLAIFVVIAGLLEAIVFATASMLLVVVAGGLFVSPLLPDTIRPRKD